MPAYAYPITIYRYRKVIKEDVVSHPDDITSINELKNLVGDCDFTLSSTYDYGLELTVHFTRFETDKECSARIEKEEEYMRNFRKAQAEHKRTRKERSHG